MSRMLVVAVYIAFLLSGCTSVLPVTGIAPAITQAIDTNPVVAPGLPAPIAAPTVSAGSTGDGIAVLPSGGSGTVPVPPPPPPSFPDVTRPSLPYVPFPVYYAGAGYFVGQTKDTPGEVGSNGIGMYDGKLAVFYGVRWVGVVDFTNADLQSDGILEVSIAGRYDGEANPYAWGDPANGLVGEDLAIYALPEKTSFVSLSKTGEAITLLPVKRGGVVEFCINEKRYDLHHYFSVYTPGAN